MKGHTTEQVTAVDKWALGVMEETPQDCPNEGSGVLIH